MSNILKNAVNTANAKKSGIANVDTPTIKNTVSSGIEDKLPEFKDFPTEVNPTLLAQEKKAKLLRQKTEAKELLLKAKEDAINQTKEQLANLPEIPKLPSLPPQRPVIDAKVLGKKLLMQALKKLEEEKNKISVENLEKGKELYSYPIKDMYKDVVK
jgi:hypothetical protein